MSVNSRSSSGVLLRLHAGGVGGGKDSELRLRHLQCIREADPWKRLVAPGPDEVLVLDVLSGDVVRQQQHLVAVDLLLVLEVQPFPRQLLHQLLHELSRSGAGIQRVHAGIAQRGGELVLEHGVHGADHPAHDLHGCVDDPVGVCRASGDALKEALVDAVQELLLLVVIGDGPGRRLDRPVEPARALQQVVAAEVPCGELVDHPLQRLRHGVARHEVRIAEYRLEDPLRHQVLPQHVFHLFHASRTVHGRPAQLQKILQRPAKTRILALLPLDNGLEFSRQLRDAGVEVLRRSVEAGDVAVLIAGETLHHELRLLPVPQLERALHLTVLKQDGLLGILDEQVVRGIPVVQLLLQLPAQIRTGSLRLPYPVHQVEIVPQLAVENDQAAVGGPLALGGYHLQVPRLSRPVQQVLKSDPCPILVPHTADLQLPQCFEVFLELGRNLGAGHVCLMMWTNRKIESKQT
jgi:hypothetical protein